MHQHPEAANQNRYNGVSIMAKSNDKLESCSAKERFPYQRQIKVRQGYYDYIPNPDNRLHPAPIPVPFVLIKGYWLNQAELPIGTPLQATISKGQIVLTALRWVSWFILSHYSPQIAVL